MVKTFKMTSNCKPETRLSCLKASLWRACKRPRSAFCAFVTVLICTPMVAQTQAPLLPQQPPDDSRYASEVPADSGFDLDLQSRLIHDNNIFSDDAQRQSDNIFQEGAVLNAWKTKPLWSLGLEYQPTILLYQRATSFNAIDQGLKLDGNYRILPYLQFRWSESVHYTTGVLDSASNDYVSLPTGPPPALNATLVTPLIRELANQSQLELVYNRSNRSFFDLSGSYGFLDFGGGTAFVPDLFNTQSGTGGFSYEYRLTRHLTVGLRYLFQQFAYALGTRDSAHNIFLTALWQMGPHAVVSVFAGPSVSVTGAPLSILAASGGTSASFPPGEVTRHWSPAAGGSFTLRSDQTVLRLTAQRLISDGGGLLTTVVSVYEGAELRRRLVYASDLVLTVGNARSVALQGLGGRGAVDSQSAEIALEHSVFENLSVHFDYHVSRQRVNQYVPFADVHDGRYTLGLVYRIGKHNLQRAF